MTTNAGKKAQRTKGNVKPSSSAKAAEILSASGFGVSSSAGFIGFGLNPGADEEFEQELNADFRVAFRKLVKKETTTKIKALKELQELIEKSDEKLVLTAWQCWPRLYSKVSLDADFKVREESHNVLDLFFRKLGRQIASQLKSVMPFWLLGEHDPFPSAAAAAKSSLQSAFPGGKRLQALKFCKEALINELADIIYGERNYKPENVPSKTDADAETDVEVKINRLCCCSLMTASTLVSELSDDDCTSSTDLLKEKFFNQPKFWNIGKSKNSSIKNAWIKFISVLICKLPSAAKQYAGQISPIVVNNMDRQTADVCRSAWDAVLLCLQTFPEEFWNSVNFQKAFFPKISSILRKGGDGVASAVCPALLPVLSKLVTSNVADLNQYYLKFSSNFEQGIRICNEPKFDPNERLEFFQSYVDCLKFIIVQLIREKDILNQILNEQFTSVLSLCLTSETMSKQKELFEIFVDFISFMIVLRDKRSDFDVDVQTKFVSNISNWCKNSIRTNTNVDATRTLLKSMTKHVECRNVLADVCKNSWNAYVADGSTFIHCLRMINDVVRKDTDLKSTTFFDCTDTEIDSITLESCVKIIFEKDLTASIDVDECVLLISLAFSCWSRLDDRSRYELLKKFLEVKSSSMRYAFLSQVVEIFDDMPPTIVESTEFRDLFLICFAEMTDKVAHGERSSYDWQVFVRILCSKRDESEILLSSLVDAILDDLLRLITKKSIDRTVLYRCVYLVARIASTLFTSSNDIATSTLARDLVLALFDLYSSDFLPNDLLETLQKTWILALTPNISMTGGFLSENSLIVKMSKHLMDRLEQNLNQNSLNRLIDVAKCLLVEFNRLLSIGETKLKLNDSSIIFIPYLLPTKENWTSLIDKLTKNDSSWKLNSQFQRTSPIYEFVDERFNAWNLTKPCLDRLIQIVSYSLRFYQSITSTFVDDDRTEKIFESYADSFVASTALIVYLSNSRQFLHATSTIVVDEIFSKSSIVVFEEFSHLIDVIRSNIDSLIRSCAGFASSSSSSDLWTLVLRQLLSDFDLSGNISESSTFYNIINRRISFDFENFSNDVNEKSLQKLTDFFASAAEENFSERKLEFLNYFVINQSSFDDVLLFDRDVSNSSTGVVNFNVALVRFLDSLIENFPDLTSDTQDFIFCSILAWLQSCLETKRYDVPCSTFAVVVVQLFNKIAEFISTSADPTNVDGKKSYVDDWNEFFLNGCEGVLVPYFVKLCDKNLHKLSGYVCCEVASALLYVDEGKILDYDLPLILSPDLDALKYPEKLQSFILNFFPLLIAERRRCEQLGAYNVLLKIVDKLNEYEIQTSSSTNDTDEQQIREIPSYFLSSLKTSHEKLHGISSVSSSTDDDDKNESLYSNVLSFFLVWKLLIKFFNSLKTDDRPVYSIYLRNSGLLDEFLSTVFSFISSDEPQFRSMDVVDSDGKFFRKILESFINRNDEDFIVRLDKTDYFTKSPTLDPKTCGSLSELRHLSCNVYFEGLCSFPAAIRQWFNNLDRKQKLTVERFTSKFISPILCLYELENITKSQRECEKMKLVTRPKTNQIVANYITEELKIGLTLTLPANYPLAQVCVEAPDRVIVSNDKWRLWMFQLITCQNGSLLDGLFLWKRCVDKHLEGVEDCTICMMSVHGTSYKLPKVTCRQCKKKFHAECLRKWFETSNNANCPLCRTEFSN